MPARLSGRFHLVELLLLLSSATLFELGQVTSQCLSLLGFNIGGKIFL